MMMTGLRSKSGTLHLFNHIHLQDISDGLQKKTKNVFALIRFYYNLYIEGQKVNMVKNDIYSPLL